MAKALPNDVRLGSTVLAYVQFAPKYRVREMEPYSEENKQAFLKRYDAAIRKGRVRMKEAERKLLKSQREHMEELIRQTENDLEAFPAGEDLNRLRNELEGMKKQIPGIKEQERQAAEWLANQASNAIGSEAAPQH